MTLKETPESNTSQRQALEENTERINPHQINNKIKVTWQTIFVESKEEDQENTNATPVIHATIARCLLVFQKYCKYNQMQEQNTPFLNYLQLELK